MFCSFFVYICHSLAETLRCPKIWIPFAMTSVTDCGVSYIRYRGAAFFPFV